MTWSRKLEQPASSKLDDFEMNFAGTKIPAEFLAVSGSGTELPIRDVRCHGEYWRQSGLASDAAESTQMTQVGSQALHFCDANVT